MKSQKTTAANARRLKPTPKIKSGAGNAEIQGGDAEGRELHGRRRRLFDYEKEALDPIDAEIIEAPANEPEFIAAAKNADAIYAKGIADHQDDHRRAGELQGDHARQRRRRQRRREGRHARGIPVTNIPDTFIEEVADHAMMLLLAGFRRLVEQDKMVRDGRWTEGRPALLKIPRLMGQTLGFISFGRVARAVAKRAAPFGLRMIAYDPFIQETLMSDHGVIPATLNEVLSQSDFVSMHAPARPEVHHMLTEKHFRQMKKTAVFINTGRGATVDEEALIKALQEELDRPCRPRRAGKGAAVAQQPDAVAWRTSR